MAVSTISARTSTKGDQGRVHCIIISARESEEYQIVERALLKEDPSIIVLPFERVFTQPELLDQCDLIFTVGGDGTVAWLVGTFFKLFQDVKSLKPICPIIRPDSVGYLRQLDLQPEERLREGLRRILEGNYRVQYRTILKTNVDNQTFFAVNEIFLHSEPHLSKINVYVESDEGTDSKELLTETMADGIMIVTPIGSTAWALSHQGQVSINEDALELVFVGGMHSSENFTLPRKKVYIDVTIKNPTVTKESIGAYNQYREKIGLGKDPIASKVLQIVYGPRLIVDGKIVAFGTSNMVIDPSQSIPFLILQKETAIAKARKLTRMRW